MQPETIYAPTDDGWRLALHRFKPRNGRRKRHPVLCVHGLAANRIHFHLDEHHSLAGTVAQRGFDVFVVELRGAGMSRAPGGRSRKLYQWGFSDYAERDMPTLVSAVLEATGASALHGLGHSMGGMLLYATSVTAAAEIRSVTAIGTPLVGQINLGLREKRLLQLATKLGPGARQRRVPLRSLVGTAGRFIPMPHKFVDGILLNAANTDPGIINRMAREGIHDVPAKLLVELTSRIDGMEEGGGNNPYGWEAQLADIRIPVFAIGGSVDRVAPPASVAAAVERVNSGDVRYREMGVEFGDRTDYGHVDLLVGRNAPEEVFPLLLDFLEEVD